MSQNKERSNLLTDSPVLQSHSPRWSTGTVFDTALFNLYIITHMLKGQPTVPEFPFALH